MITTSSSQKNIGQMISVPKLAELDKLLDDDKKNELRCLATVQKLRNEMYTAFRGNTAIAKFFVQNFPSLDKNAGELMTVKNYLLEKISYHYSDLCIDQARQSKQFSKELKKVAITNGTELAVDSADYMTILHEVKAKLMKNKVENIFAAYNKEIKKIKDHMDDEVGSQANNDHEVGSQENNNHEDVEQHESYSSQENNNHEDVEQHESYSSSTSSIIYMPTWKTTLIGDFNDKMEIEATSTPIEVNVCLQWPNDCENPNTNKAFLTYLCDYVHQPDLLSDGQQIPPESVIEGQKWNMNSYHKFLQTYFEIRKSGIHNYGCFLHDGCSLMPGDLLIYSGYFYKTALEDGYELDIDLNTSPQSDTKKRTLNTRKKGLIVNDETSDVGVSKVVYIRPGVNDILKYMNDMLYYGDNVLESFENYSSFILQVNRMLVGVDAKVQRKAYSASSTSGLSQQIIDSVGELTLFYGENYDFHSRPKKARALVIDETDNSTRPKKARGSIKKKKIPRTPPKVFIDKSGDNNDGDAEKQDDVFIARKLFDEMVATSNYGQNVEDSAQIDWSSDDSDGDTSSPVRSSTQRKQKIERIDKKILGYMDKNFFADCFVIPNGVKEDNFLSLVDDLLRKLNPPLSRLLLRLSFSFEDAMVIDEGLKNTRSERFRTFRSLRSLAKCFQLEIKSFTESANVYLFENKILEITFTDPDLVSIPITRNNIPPLVHSSSNSECSCKQFDFIAYCFFENVTLDIRDCYKVLESFHYHFNESVTKKQQIDTEEVYKFVATWTIPENIVVLNAFDILIVNKSCLFKVIERKNGSLEKTSEECCPLYAFVSHSYDSCEKEEDKYFSLLYEPFYTQCKHVMGAVKSSWSEPWSADLLKCVKKSFGEMCSNKYDFFLKEKSIRRSSNEKLTFVVVNDEDKESLKKDDANKEEKVPLKWIHRIVDLIQVEIQVRTDLLGIELALESRIKNIHDKMVEKLEKNRKQSQSTFMDELIRWALLFEFGDGMDFDDFVNISLGSLKGGNLKAHLLVYLIADSGDELFHSPIKSFTVFWFSIVSGTKRMIYLTDPDDDFMVASITELLKSENVEGKHQLLSNIIKCSGQREFFMASKPSGLVTSSSTNNSNSSSSTKSSNKLEISNEPSPGLVTSSSTNNSNSSSSANSSNKLDEISDKLGTYLREYLSSLDTNQARETAKVNFQYHSLEKFKTAELTSWYKFFQFETIIIDSTTRKSTIKEALMKEVLRLFDREEERGVLAVLLLTDETYASSAPYHALNLLWVTKIVVGESSLIKWTIDRLMGSYRMITPGIPLTIQQMNDHSSTALVRGRKSPKSTSKGITIRSFTPPKKTNPLIVLDMSPNPPPAIELDKSSKYVDEFKDLPGIPSFIQNMVKTTSGNDNVSSNAEVRYGIEFTNTQKGDLIKFLESTKTLDNVRKAIGDIQASCLSRLLPDVWLNDDVINAYIELLQRRPVMKDKVVLTTYFYACLTLRWEETTKSDRDLGNIKWYRSGDNLIEKFGDFLNLDTIFIPCGLGIHWILVLVCMKTKEICYIDSLWSDTVQHKKTFNHALSYLILPALTFLANEYFKSKNIDDNSKEEYDFLQWPRIVIDTVKQVDGNDCGVHLCMNIDFLSDNLNPYTSYEKANINKQDLSDLMDHFRLKIAVDLLRGYVDY